MSSNLNTPSDPERPPRPGRQKTSKMERSHSNKLSERFLDLVPRKMLTFGRKATSDDREPERDDDDDVESRRKRETSVMKRWIVCVTVAGLVVSALVLAIVLISLLSSSKSAGPSDQDTTVPDDDDQKEEVPRVPPEAGGFHNFVVKNLEGAMNDTADPCDDFYEYACGRWPILNPPPAGVSRWSNFEELTVTIWDMMQEQLDNVARGARGSTPKEGNKSRPLLEDANPFIVDLVGVYYNTCENETHLADRKAAPLEEVLAKMDDLYDSKLRDLQPLAAFQDMLEYVHHELTVHAFFGWKVEMDNSIKNQMVIELTAPSGDLLPQGTVVEGNKDLIKIYKKYAKNLLEIVGTYRNGDPENEAQIIIDQLKIYHPLNGSPLVNVTNVVQLNDLAPFLDWHKYFNDAFNKVGAFITPTERILSMIQEYLLQLSDKIKAEISSNGSQRLYKYLRWQVIQYYSQFLHKEARNAILPLFDGISGENTSELPNFRYRPCIKELEDRLAIPMGYLLLETVKKQLPGRTKVKDIVSTIENMALRIRDTYKVYINSFRWLTEEAKAVLIDKLDHINILVGYPPILDDEHLLQSTYEPLEFKKGHLIQNQINLLKFNQERKMRFLRQPASYTEWELLSPMSLISFYVYRRNTLLVPLGGFMHPLYSQDLPESLSYATMGLFISHEIGHAIDFVGRTRDHYGRTNATLWDDSTVTDFVQRVLCRVNEYSERYYPVEGLLTIAEVMADDGSIGTAYKTVQHRLRETRFPEPLEEFMRDKGLSPDQLFFLYYAQLFCSASPPGEPLKGIDHYPPHPVRVRATLANTPEFHRVFGCPRGSFMNPVRNQTCDIW
ncbi:endothelin-converting enzyme 1-like [Macrobrachium rosenbergii]|uniref:endothelin-converting enzyme 1-like n=1 Tax=Macrobrachium rosenbergii TaxID=79674 RepID=UPI0034D57733